MGCASAVNDAGDRLARKFLIFILRNQRRVDVPRCCAELAADD
jgi:hypothetical protein